MPEENNNKNIVLIGMMGAGKSYIGAKLAKLLSHFSYIDTDAEIEKRTGLTIPQIFEQQGEAHFRKLESSIIKELSKNKNQIISIGGGAFENPDTIKVLKTNSLTFYLKAPARTLFERVQGDTGRPLLNADFSLKNVEDLLRKRDKNYFKADFVIDTYQKQAYTILNDIISEYENYVKQTTFC